MEKYKREKGAVLSPKGMVSPRQLCLQHLTAGRKEKKRACEEKKEPVKKQKERNIFCLTYIALK